MKKDKKAVNAGLQALIKFLNTDGDLPEDQKLREELTGDIAGLLKPSRQRVKLVAVAGTKEKAFVDSSPEGALEIVLYKAYQLRPRFVTFHVSEAQGPSKYIDDGPVTFIDLFGKQFMAEMVIKDSSKRTVYYQFLDAAIRDKSFSKLRACPQCKAFFLGRRCMRCAKKKRNRYMATYMKKRRKGIAKKKDAQKREEKQKTLVKNFQAFIDKASSRIPADQIAVGPIVKRFGGGSLNLGWKKINPWLHKRANDLLPLLDTANKKIVIVEFS